MKHVFIINPAAMRVKSRLRELISEIDEFFHERNNSNYIIHVTRWVRDAMGCANRFALEADEPVRIHSVGGSGTLYEIINGTIGLPNVQIAAYPMGDRNFFIRFFGASNEHHFNSLADQVFSGIMRIDAIKCQQNYALGYAMVGLEALSEMNFSEMTEKTNLPIKFCRYYTAFKTIMQRSHIFQRYEVSIDGRDCSGEYDNILIAGVPCYGRDLIPAPDAHPSDGLMDIYLIKIPSGVRQMRLMRAYMSGEYMNMSRLVVHERCKNISVSADGSIVMSIDGEKICERSVSLQVVPAAIDFVCPDSIAR